MKDVARILRITERTAQRHLRSGVIPSRKLGGSYLVTLAALNAWLNDSAGQLPEAI